MSTSIDEKYVKEKVEKLSKFLQGVFDKLRKFFNALAKTVVEKLSLCRIIKCKNHKERIRVTSKEMAKGNKVVRIDEYTIMVNRKNRRRKR